MVRATLGEEVSALEEELEETKKILNESLNTNNIQAEDIKDLTASLNGATREIEELYEQLQYYEELHPEIKTTWNVKQRMEEA